MEKKEKSTEGCAYRGEVVVMSMRRTANVTPIHQLIAVIFGASWLVCSALFSSFSHASLVEGDEVSCDMESASGNWFCDPSVTNIDLYGLAVFKIKEFIPPSSVGDKLVVQLTSNGVSLDGPAGNMLDEQVLTLDSLAYTDGAIIGFSLSTSDTTGLDDSDITISPHSVSMDLNNTNWGIGGHAFIGLQIGAIPSIDIKPGDSSNIINLRSGGFVPIAILTEGDFDALQVDPDTVKFGPGEAEPARYRVEDVEKDGDADFVLYFRIQKTGIACFDTQATLTGVLYDNTPFIGTDSIEVKNCR